MGKSLSKLDLQPVVETRDPCCMSIYMPTHRATTGKEQDQIRFKNLLRRGQERAAENSGCETALDRNLAKAQRLLQDDFFWRQTTDGLALFISSEQFMSYRLPLDFEELLVLAGRFHIKPLLPLLSGDDRFFILAISQNEVRLFQCNRFDVLQIDLPEVAGGLQETMQYDQESGTQLQFHTGSAGGDRSRPAIFHGHAVDAQEDKDEILQYLREVDRRLWKILREETAPLVLAGVDFLLPIYRNANSYSNLLDDGISGNPEGRSAEDLHRAALDIVRPCFTKNQDEALARYRRKAGTGLTSDDLRQILTAARHARIEVLFVGLFEQQWGRYDPDRNEVILHDRARHDSEELLNLAAVETLYHGGTVYGLEADQLPGAGFSAAALLRY